jgi:uncharacterized RDD family membrane protein YckC
MVAKPGGLANNLDMPRGFSQLDTTIDVVTPENIAFHYRVAGPFRRWPAFLLDLGIRIGLYMACAFVLILLLGMTRLGGGPMVAIMLISWFVLEWFYGGFFETFWNGQTPGKRVMSVRVVSVNGQPINGMQAVMRNLLRLVDMAPFLSLEMLGIPLPMYSIPTFLVGLVAMALNRRFQRIGDLVCGTVVIIEDRHWLTGVAKIDDPRAARLAEYLPADFVVGRSLSQALSAYVERRRYFSPARCREVARHLAEPLLDQFHLPPDTSHDLLLCALYYKAFIADRAEEDDATSGSPFEAPTSPFAAPRTMSDNAPTDEPGEIIIAAQRDDYAAGRTTHATASLPQETEPHAHEATV